MTDKKSAIRLTEAQIRAIEKIVTNGERAEVLPSRDGVKILRLQLIDTRTGE